ncbi:hypothetical protein N566_04730 [Streptomycetaceae bacterium MP113-05]|nr:hypothetical protein N566_04730 [Streptomycetaceae bacterium MP113-05]
MRTSPGRLTAAIATGTLLTLSGPAAVSHAATPASLLQADPAQAAEANETPGLNDSGWQ